MKLLRVLFLLAASAAVVLGQTNSNYETRKLSLQEVIELTLKNNLDLQIDRYNPKIALFNVQNAYSGYDPTFSTSGQHNHTESGAQLVAGGFGIAGSVNDVNSFTAGVSGTSPVGTTYSVQGNANDSYGVTSFHPFESSAGSASFSISQPLLRNFWIDSNRLNIRVAKNRLTYSEQTLRLQMMQTLTSAEQAYFDLIYSRENVLVQQKAVELAERLVAENRKRLEVGALAPLDLQSAEAQAATTRAALLAAQSQLGTQDRLLKSFITDRYRQLYANVIIEPSANLLAPKPVVNLQDSWGKALSLRPEIIQAKLDVERQGIVLKYDRNQLLPEVDAFATYGYNGSGKEFSDVFYTIQQTDLRAYSYGGRLSVPLLNLRARTAYSSDKAAMQQLVLGVKLLEQNVMIVIDNDIGTILSNFDQVQATRSARQYQESALDAEQKKLESGKSTTYTVLQVQRDLTTARGNEIQALDNYNRSLSQLSLHEGSTLDRMGINLEVK